MFDVFGVRLAIWDLCFVLGIALGYVVLHRAFRFGERARVPPLLPVRWLITVYVSIVGAKLFAYLFDLNTTILPPASVDWARYYLDPLSGPKTLYGAIIILPLGVLAVSRPWGDVGLRDALDRWTPALMTVLASARIGCLLQGCCHGRQSSWLGVAFPAGTPPAVLQHRRGLIPAGVESLPVLPTQAISAGVLAALAVWCFVRVRRGRRDVFVDAMAVYSGFRFLVEFVRDDPERNLYGALSTSQWIALAILGMYAAWRVLGSTFVFGRSSDATTTR
jgi:phosphatidylglycerol:prolipoprotein diacylglycerol transferase